MHGDPEAPETQAAPQRGNSKFIPFVLILCVALAIGWGIRYYNGKYQEAIHSTWKVYFSEVDAGTNPYPLDKRLIERLTTATDQIDTALYHLSAAPIADALIEAHHRGVQVRVVTETDNINETQIERLQAAGIPVVDDAGADSYMHHKFFVIDERYVWTGSYNTTYNGAYKNNNNVILIDSVRLAYNFTQEFRELFHQARGEKPDGAAAVYPEITLSDGTQISTHFSPDNDIVSSLLHEIGNAQQSIHFMAFSFTQDSLGNAMRKQFKSGVDVRGVFEEKQISQHSEYELMKAEGLGVVLDSSKSLMHHKVIVIDAETVITGSYNFSKNAEERNNENLLIIKDNPEIAATYLAEFDRIVR